MKTTQAATTLFLTWIGFGLAFAALSACTRAPALQDSQPDEEIDDSTSESQVDGEIENDTDPEMTTDEEPSNETLTSLEVEAVSKAIRAAHFMGVATLALQPVSSLQGLVEGTMELPVCPLVTVDVDAGNTLTTFTYEPFCAPDAFSSSEISGSVSARVYLAIDAFETTEVNLGSTEGMFTGAVSGGFSGESERGNFALSLSMESAELRAQGSASAEADAALGRTTLLSATLTLDPSTETSLTAVYDAVTLQGQSMLPMSGSVTIEMPPGEDARRERLEVTFWAETPVTRTAQVARNGVVISMVSF